VTNPVEIFFDSVDYETDHAYLLVIDDQKVWIPKSQSRLVEPGVMEVPEWLAIEKVLI